MDKQDMSASAALLAATEAGIDISADQDDLILEANAQPPCDILEGLKCNKADILRLFNLSKNKRSNKVSGRQIGRSKVSLIDYLLPLWLDKHPAPSPPGRCALCGELESASSVVVPFGTKSGTHAWLHSECWEDWFRFRNEEAMGALSSV
jgi:hypothetical protein